MFDGKGREFAIGKGGLFLATKSSLGGECCHRLNWDDTLCTCNKPRFQRVPLIGYVGSIPEYNYVPMIVADGKFDSEGYIFVVLQKGNENGQSDDEGYEQVWERENRDKPPPPAPKKKYAPEQFNMLKVLGKGSFGKVHA
ncbi:hypothetical protein DPMN_122301 [Dreissena polymorpha]|uniref:Uncharacterized protein n=1 Tax=Dreissena polymorpha TaxID=45954 RepID=A0A9D4GPF0_DREPO|nr:hypothetical protein DPMN_122301 [Dreissena polymorpha]